DQDPFHSGSGSGSGAGFKRRRSQFVQLRQNGSSFETASAPFSTARRARTLVGAVHVNGRRTITAVGGTPRTSAAAVQVSPSRNSMQVPCSGEQVLVLARFAQSALVSPLTPETASNPLPVTTIIDPAAATVGPAAVSVTAPLLCCGCGFCT